MLPSKTHKIAMPKLPAQASGYAVPSSYQAAVQAIQSKFGSSPYARILLRRLPKSYPNGSLGESASTRASKFMNARPRHFEASSQAPKQTAVVPNKTGRLEAIRIRKQSRDIRQMLTSIVTHEEALRWMQTSNSDLDNLTPDQMIRNNQTDRIVELVRRAQEGIYV